MASQKDLPGWGWWFKQGATTLWEQWNGSESRNHIMFGDIVAWFYQALAGINHDPAQPGFKHVLIKPQPVGDLTFARAEYDSIRGKIVSDWKIENGQFKLRVVIPPNTTATVCVPAAGVNDVREGRGPALKAKGVTLFRQEKERAVFEVESGSYTFTAPYKAGSDSLTAANNRKNHPRQFSKQAVVAHGTRHVSDRQALANAARPVSRAAMMRSVS